MKEQIDRLPVDPNSARYSFGDEVVVALGRNEHAGRLFTFLENCGDDLQNALTQSRSRSKNPLDIIVVGPGIDEDRSDTHEAVVYDHGQFGLWGAGPGLLEIQIEQLLKHKLR